MSDRKILKTLLPPILPKMFSSLEIEQQLAELMHKLAEVKEAEKRKVEEESDGSSQRRRRGGMKRSVRSWSSAKQRRCDVRS